MAVPLQSPYAQFFDSNGDPLSGGKVYTYIAGTTTPKATYTDADEGTQAANPIILDSSGRAAIWITGTYRIDVYTSADVLVRSVDDVPAFTAGGDMTKAVYDAANIAQQVVGTTAVQTITNKTISASNNTITTILNGTTQATTSGTSIDFTGIPSTAKRITVMFNAVSTNGTANFLLQIGDGAIVTSGYASSGQYGGTAATSTAGFLARVNSAAEAASGIVVIQTLGSNIWVCTGMVRPNAGTGQGGETAGNKTLSGTLDRLRLTTVGATDTFDSGSINISWES